MITGATGNIGSELTKALAAQGIPFRAMVRRLDEPAARDLQKLPGAEVIAGDFNDAASLQAALSGIERAFLLTPSSAQAEAQQLSFVEQAQQAGVKHLVKQSQWAAAADSPVRFLRYRARHCCRRRRGPHGPQPRKPNLQPDRPGRPHPRRHGRRVQPGPTLPHLVRKREP